MARTRAFAWLQELADRQAAVSINAGIARLSLGNFGDHKPISDGLSELRIDTGPGLPGVDHEALVHALGVVARARGGMSRLAKETRISRQGLYKAIAKDGNPSFETVMKIVGAFGVRLSAKAAAD